MKNYKNVSCLYTKNKCIISGDVRFTQLFVSSKPLIQCLGLYCTVGGLRVKMPSRRSPQRKP